eukprot:764417-Hanusia_phi.AAC.8
MVLDVSSLFSDRHSEPWVHHSQQEDEKEQRGGLSGANGFSVGVGSTKSVGTGSGAGEGIYFGQLLRIDTVEPRET